MLNSMGQCDQSCGALCVCEACSKSKFVNFTLLCLSHADNPSKSNVEYKETRVQMGKRKSPTAKPLQDKSGPLLYTPMKQHTNTKRGNPAVFAIKGSFYSFSLCHFSAPAL